ncbi:electron transfer flavoprotein subunit beta/FixA family protein [bacterium]|jgi:electron transfer flavoprotein beta subunit|nr:electron transfer flavoprotein subunit beta/FixA family protein [bacterium]
MNFIVCIKQVPGTTEVKINPKTNTLIREGVESIVNPFDTYAIEEGLRLKERMGGKVTVISMGPPQAESALREALSMGCDEAVLLTDPAFAGSDTLATSYTLACGIRKIGEFDLVICGKQAIDGDTAQVGPGIAEKLEIPAVTYVKKIEEINEALVRVERMMEEGYEVIEMGLPALITVVKEINEPRLPSLKGMMRARKAKIQIWNASDIACEKNRIGQPGSPTIVNRIFTPPPRKGGELLLGDPEEQARKLVENLRQAKVI